MMTQVARSGNSKIKASPFGLPQRPLLLSLVGIIVALVVVLPGTLTIQRDSKSAAAPSTVKSKMGKAEISSGVVGGIPYYHCGDGDKPLVLLHGARFTKEDWKSSGILEKFGDSGAVSALAMDLPVSAGHSELKSLLTTMQEKQLVKLPVALVTPSASGKTISDWMMHGDVTELPGYISKWIPVAPGSVSQATDAQVQSLTNNLPIFAIYGNMDGMGKTVTERLASSASAKTLELEGGHPCYLDSPDEFVAAVVADL